MQGESILPPAARISSSFSCLSFVYGIGGTAKVSGDGAWYTTIRGHHHGRRDIYAVAAAGPSDSKCDTSPSAVDKDFEAKVSMSATQPVVLDRSFVSLRLGTPVVCCADHLRMMKHTLSIHSNLRRIDRISLRDRVERAARIFGTFGPVAQEVAVGCLHEQQQRRRYTGVTTRDV